MKLMLFIVAVMTWTIESKSLVTGSGDLPSYVEAAYSNTYNKGIVREGDVAVLSLSNTTGITVESIDVYVKSNKEAGAGIFTVTSGGEQVVTRSGTFKSWTGAYDNSSFHAIRLLAQKRVLANDLVIRLAGTTNSLTIEKYVITYQPLPIRSVRLMNGNRLYATLEEAESGAGIVLPALRDTADWEFIGWSERECWTVYGKQDFFPPGHVYSPQDDAVLWAMYRHPDNTQEEYVTDLASGDYLYVNREIAIALTGVPKNGRMQYDVTKRDDAQQIYTIDFAGGDTAYITHKESGTPIGYSGKNMASIASPWRVYHDGDETIFYTEIGGQKYVLWLNNEDLVTHEYYAGLKSVQSLRSYMGLLMPSEDGTAYTCHPECGVGVEEVKEDGLDGKTGERVVQVGIYELHIRNGRKYIIIKQ